MRRAPWPDFAGNPIHEGDTIRHPHSGESGVVVFLPMYPDPGDAWRVNYGDQYESRLCLQIGDKGQAIVIPTPDLPTPKGTTVSTDQQIESEIQAKGLTAPRVTPDALQQNIVDEFYFTAAQGISAAYPIAAHSIDLPVGVKLLTFCVLVLRNGFTVTGESACASPENFDAELGRKIARENAKQKIWPLMGYQLREQLYQATQPAQPPEPNPYGLAPHQQRVVEEQRELEAKRELLNAFMQGDKFFVLCDEPERIRLIEQYNAMTAYSHILVQRIAAFVPAHPV